MTTAVTLAERIRHHALAAPDSVFLRWRGDRLTYGCADDLMRRVAATLLEIDRASSGSGRVVVFSPNSPAAILVWLGAQAAGLESVTLNREQRGHVLRDAVERSNPSIVVADGAGMEVLDSLDAAAGVPRFVLDRGPDVLGDLHRNLGAALIRPVSADRSDVATIMFSSGTTGPSKGVVIPHGMFDAGPRRLMTAWDVTHTDVLHCWVPWFHIAAQLDVLALAIHARAEVALFERFSLSRFWEQIRDSECTVFGGFVSVLEMLYAQQPDPRDREHRLRFGIAGHIPAALKADFETRFGVRMLDAYGMSEAEPLTIPGLAEDLPAGSCGRANPDFEIQIQTDNGAVCDPGREGQIVFRPLVPDVMMRGYLDDEPRTRAAWRDGWFCTGDTGVMDADGRIFFRERMSEFIRVRGENVSPQEVETVLMEHPAVAEVGVVGVPSPLGEHDIKAVVVLRQGVPFGDLPDWSARRMAKFMLPAYYEFVEQLPRTPTSKLRRTELRTPRGRVLSAADLAAHRSRGGATA